MADFKVDTDELRDTATTLSSITKEFEKAVENVESTANAVGDATLAEAVRRFSTSWNQHREELTETLVTLTGHLTNAADNIEAADQALADNLEGDG